MEGFGGLSPGGYVEVPCRPNPKGDGGLQPGSSWEPFGLFAFTPIAVAILATGIPFMALAGRHLLPRRDPMMAPLPPAKHCVPAPPDE